MGCCGNKNDDNEMEMSDGKKGGKAGKYGKARGFDPAFAGPTKNRSCTDIPCCILFVLYIVGMIALGIAAFYMGNPNKLLHSVDSYGNICGYDEAVKDKPKLVFFDLTECITSSAGIASQGFAFSCPTQQVCVEKCPDKNQVGAFADPADLVCTYDVDTSALKDTAEKLDHIGKRKCAPYYLKSTDVLNRCIPTIATNEAANLIGLTTADNQTVTVDKVNNGSLVVQALLNLQNLGEKVIADVKESWWWILAALGIAMVASFVLIVLMRWIAGLIVWLTIYAVLTLIGFGIYYSWTKYQELKTNANSTAVSWAVIGGLDTYTNNQETWYYLTIILGVILGILVLLLLAVRKRIQVAVALIKEASRAITHMKFSLFFPIIPWLLQLILFGWFAGVLVFLVTAGGPAGVEVSNGTDTGNPCTEINKDYSVPTNSTVCKFVNFQDNDHLFRMQVYHLFGWFWVMNFIVALGQCTMAGAFASYYWAPDKNTDIPTFPVAAAFGRTLRYHTGSLAFGSLIIALVQLARAALEYLDHHLKEAGKTSKVAQYVMKCLKCCFWCLEKFLKFLNKNAYIEGWENVLFELGRVTANAIQIAVYGENFCRSAKNAFFLLMRNIVRVVVLDKVTDFILLLSQLAITAGMGVGSFYWFGRQRNLNYYLAPVFIIVVGSYMISSAFFSVYSMAIDTVFLCFLEDLERHDGSEEKPYYMSKSLRKILGKKNKRPSDSE